MDQGLLNLQSFGPRVKENRPSGLFSERDGKHVSAELYRGVTADLRHSRDFRHAGDFRVLRRDAGVLTSQPKVWFCDSDLEGSGPGPSKF